MLSLFKKKDKTSKPEIYYHRRNDNRITYTIYLGAYGFCTQQELKNWKRAGYKLIKIKHPFWFEPKDYPAPIAAQLAYWLIH